MDKMAFTLLDEVDEAVSGFFWAMFQDIWDDLYRAYIKLPGSLDRGPHGRQLQATLGAPASREARLIAIQDGCVVEMYLYLLSKSETIQVQSLLSEVPAGLPFVDKRIEFLDEGN